MPLTKHSSTGYDSFADLCTYCVELKNQSIPIQKRPNLPNDKELYTAYVSYIQRAKRKDEFGTALFVFHYFND